jgi:hypothetical protein
VSEMVTVSVSKLKLLKLFYAAFTSLMDGRQQMTDAELLDRLEGLRRLRNEREALEAELREDLKSRAAC